MVSCATAFRADAEILSSRVAPASNASALLNLLAFEILLKALLAVTEIPMRSTHDYLAIFNALATDVRDRVSTLADARDPQVQAGKRMAELLPQFARNFTVLRYPYEAYVACTDGAFRAAGAGWTAAGAAEVNAVHRYYPEELHAISDALLQTVQEKMGALR